VSGPIVSDVDRGGLQHEHDEPGGRILGVPSAGTHDAVGAWLDLAAHAFDLVRSVDPTLRVLAKQEG
jgi:hypothetical protein